MDELSMRLSQRRDESNSAYAKDRNASHYNKDDIIEVPQIGNQNDELIRYQSIKNVHEEKGGDIN